MSASPSTRSVAVAQTCPIAGDVRSNLDEHLRLIRIAADEGASIIVFPELSLTGYELASARDLAFSQEDPSLSPLRDAASSRSSTLVVGAPVALGSRLHIGAFIIRPDGRVALYTKHRLGAFQASASCDGVVPPPEASVFSPGDRDPLIRTHASTAAIAVCADIARASHPRRAARRGANTYLASMFVIPSELERDAAKLQGYSVEHGMLVALANFGSPTGGLAAAGRSSVWSEKGELLARLGSKGAGVAVATEVNGTWRTTSIMLDAPQSCRSI